MPSHQPWGSERWGQQPSETPKERADRVRYQQLQDRNAATLRRITSQANQSEREALAKAKTVGGRVVHSHIRGGKMVRASVRRGTGGEQKRDDKGRFA